MSDVDLKDCPFCGDEPTIEGGDITCHCGFCFPFPVEHWNRRPEILLAETKPSLREKLSKVAAHCAYVQKGGVNEFHGYPYAMASQVFAKVNEALEANRLISIPVFRIVSSVDHLVTVACSLEIRDIDSGDEIHTIAYGSGSDKGDKAVMKAQTAALKYAWMMLLNISTGDDPEADSTTDSAAHGEPIKPRQTPEERARKVERNKDDRNYSPEVIALSDRLNEELAKETYKPPKAKWPGGHTAESIEAAMDGKCEACGAPLVERHASKAKGGYAYETCEASDKAFKAGIKLEGKHTWRRLG